jgi:hypothetical protein
MSTQIDLPLFRPKVADHKEDISRLISFLRGRGVRTADEIQATLKFGSGQVNETYRRYIRLLASESECQIIGTANGYKLTLEATPDEMSHWRARQEAQVEATQERIIKTEKVWHGRFPQ